MTNLYYNMPLEELCARVLREKKLVLDDMKAPEIAGSSANVASISRSAGLLEGKDLVSEHGTQHLDIAISILRQRLEDETLEVRAVFDGRNDDEEGAIGTVRNKRLLTDVGVKIEQCLEATEALLHMRSVLCARIEAERIINRKLRF